MKTWKTLLPLFMVIFVDVMGLGMVFPVLAPLFFSPNSTFLAADTSSAMRTGYYSFMLALWPIFMFISTPLLGDLSDKLGRKKILLLCLFGEALSYMLGSMAISTSSITLFLISRVLAGAFAGSQPIAQAAIADISTPETKVRNMSYIVLACSLGIVVGPLIGGFTSSKTLVSWFNFTTPFQIATVIALLNAVSLMLSFRETHEPKQIQKINLFKSVFLFVDAFKKKTISILSMSFFLLQLSWSLYFQSIALFLNKHAHQDVDQIGIFYCVIGVASSFALTYGIKWLNTRAKEKYIMMLGSVLQAVGAVCLIVFSPLWGAYLSAVLSALGIAFTYTVGISLYSNYAGKDSQGWIMGVAGALAGAAWAVTAFLCGALSEVSIFLPFVVVAVLSALGLLQMRRIAG